MNCLYCTEKSTCLRYKNYGEWYALPVCNFHAFPEHKQKALNEYIALLAEVWNRIPYNLHPSKTGDK